MKKCIYFLIFLLTQFVLTTKDSQAQWVPATKLPSNDDNVVTALKTSGNMIFAATVSGDGYGGYGDIFLSKDNGDNWTSISSGLLNTEIHCIEVTTEDSGANIFVGTHGGVYHSTNSGKTWSGTNVGFPNNRYVISLRVLGTNILAGTGEGLFLSTNKGASWLRVNSGIPNNISVRSFVVLGSTLFAGCREGGVYFSSDSGITWSKSGSGLLDTSWINSIAVSGSNLFAGTFWNGVYLSTDKGNSWSEVNNRLTNKRIRVLEVFGSNIFAGTDDGIFISTDNGSHWISTGLRHGSGVLAASDMYLFSGDGDYGSVYKRPLSELVELVTDIKASSNTLPSEFYLGQNYPNPFNPSTKISWQSPVASYQTLKVYDVLGNEVATLVNEYKPAGKHEVTFDASKLSSGIYFYKLQTGNFISTKKMILLK